MSRTKTSRLLELSFAVVLLGVGSGVCQPADPINPARALPFKPIDDDFFIRYGGQSKLTTVQDAKTLEKEFGKAQAKALAQLVDFTKEKIVLVSWTTSGPPEGKLTYEIKPDGKDRRVVFFVQGPKGVLARGERARIAADFFAVPKGMAVFFDPKER